MINEILKALQRIEEIDTEMENGNFDNICEFYSLNENLLSTFRDYQRKLPAKSKIYYDDTAIFEAFRVIYALKKCGIPI